MTKVTRHLWDGIIKYDDEDVPPDLRAFNSFGKSVLMWFEHSRELYRSSCYLMEQRPRVWNEITHLLQAPIALMLGAYAIEALLKMVIVGKHCDTYGITLDSQSAKDFIPPTHNLVNLVKRANLRVNQDDRDLLKDLSRYSTWAGRYPIPLGYPGYQGPALAEAVPPPPEMVPQQHPTWPRFVALYQKLYALSVRKTMKGSVILKPKS